MVVIVMVVIVMLISDPVEATLLAALCLAFFPAGSTHFAAFAACLRVHNHAGAGVPLFQTKDVGFSEILRRMQLRYALMGSTSLHLSGMA